jgi:hypothetical protein
MTESEIREHLRDLTPTIFASKYIFEPVPYVFEEDMDSYIDWKGTLGDQIDVDPRAIAVIGSAGVGVSLNPDKGLKAFDSSSDIDVAVVSFHHFDVAWRSLRSMSSAALFKLNKRQRSSYRAHEMKYIYWGTVATDRLLEFLPFAQSWVPGLSHMASLSPTRGRDIKARIYRDFESLRAYQLSSVEQARGQVEQDEETR